MQVETTYKRLGLSAYGIMQDDISVKILSPTTTTSASEASWSGSWSASEADRFAKCPTLSNYNWTNFNYANNGQCTVVSRRLKDIPNASCVQVCPSPAQPQDTSVLALCCMLASNHGSHATVLALGSSLVLTGEASKVPEHISSRQRF